MFPSIDGPKSRVAQECRVGLGRLRYEVRYEETVGGSPSLCSELGVCVNELAECHALVSERMRESLLCRHGACSR